MDALVSLYFFKSQQEVLMLKDKENQDEFKTDLK